MPQDATTAEQGVRAAAGERRPTRVRLLSNTERLRRATDAAELGWWDAEPDRGRLAWSPALAAMFGIPSGAAVSLDDVRRGLHPDDRDRVAASFAAASDPARRACVELEFRTIGKADGVIRCVYARGRGVFDANGRCQRITGIAIDVTQRHLVKERQRTRQQEEADLRERFIAVLGHDLRSPLASIASGTRVLVDRPGQAAELALQIGRSIERMSELVEHLLEFAHRRLGGGFVVTREGRASLAPVLFGIVDEFRLIHPDRDLSVDIALPEPVSCDCQRIGQLLSNLLGNAFAYGCVTGPIAVRARVDDGRFELSVTNAGPEIDPSEIERIFQPYVRGTHGSARGGLGLGLYICSEIARGHDGTIEVRSEGGTTCFTFRMPAGG